MAAKQGDPEHTGTQLTYVLVDEPDGQTRMAVVAEYYGIALATDSRLADPVPVRNVDLDEHANVMRFRGADYPRRTLLLEAARRR